MQPNDRDRIRNKQDQLLSLIERTNPAQLDLPIAPHERAPVARALYITIYPEWESDIDRCIAVLEEYLRPIS